MKRPRVSTRLSIVTQSLADALERLAELPDSVRVQALRAEAKSCELDIRAWALAGPEDKERAAIVKRVLDLHMEVMALARQT